MKVGISGTPRRDGNSEILSDAALSSFASDNCGIIGYLGKMKKRLKLDAFRELFLKARSGKHTVM
jgi:hypothetical protein